MKKVISLIKKAIRFLREEWQDHEMCCHANGEKFYLLEFIWYLIRDGVCAIICKIRGHDIVITDSWCSPDSGGEHWECRRCGYGGTINYY